MPTLLPAQSYADSRIANALATYKSLVIHHPITCQVRRFGKTREGDTLFFGTLEGLVRRRRMPLSKTTQNNCSFSGKNVLDGLLEIYQQVSPFRPRIKSHRRWPWVEAWPLY
jgi:hypothetical protein